MRRAAEMGCARSSRCLGLVSYADLIGLMRYLTALINPSLFEGWSTTVEEAKSLGKTIILSDIPVHREQAPENGRFFDPGWPRTQLADRMIEVADGYSRRAQEMAQFDRAPGGGFRIAFGRLPRVSKKSSLMPSVGPMTVSSLRRDRSATGRRASSHQPDAYVRRFASICLKEVSLSAGRDNGFVFRLRGVAGQRRLIRVRGFATDNLSRH